MSDDVTHSNKSYSTDGRGVFVVFENRFAYLDRLMSIGPICIDEPISLKTGASCS